MQLEKNALISVSDKSGLLDFARNLGDHGYKIYSTGGTAKALAQAGIAVVNISDLTGFPEIMDGRVKTLHPKVFGGILARGGLASHAAEAQSHAIPLFDVVVVNLYPFSETVKKPGASFQDAIENIDVGGVTLIRAAAKNQERVSVVTSPGQYSDIQKELAENDGKISRETRQTLAVTAFLETSKYDAAIHNFLAEQAGRKNDAGYLDSFVLPLRKTADLRYGENPHQQAALYRREDVDVDGVINAEQLHGKALSFNNIMDGDTALQIAKEFTRPAIAILKHANPCGVAVENSLADAYENALATDRTSAFGGIVGANRKIDADTAKLISKVFTEVIIAPDFSDEALEILTQKKNIRLLKTAAFDSGQAREEDFRPVSGGLLVQDRDLGVDDENTFRIVTERKPDDAEWRAMLFGWKVVKWVKSNAIVFVGENRTLGIGAGQMSRVDAAKIAVMKAKDAGLDLSGGTVASDAFFPFADGVEAAAAAGAKGVIQPGGSIRDEEVIAAANRSGVAMAFTGKRHFRH